MQTRKLGQTDLMLTTVGLGTWAMGGPWQFGWGPQDDGEAVAAILTALDTGINWIDTAAGVRPRPLRGAGGPGVAADEAQALHRHQVRPALEREDGRKCRI